MSTSDFTDAASAAAEKQWPREPISGHRLSGPERMDRRIGFTMGAEWARAYIAAQEVTDAEVRAVWYALGSRVTIAMEYEDLRSALSAARAAQRDKEKR